MHYRFISSADFQKILDNEALLHHLVIDGHHYGSPLSDFLRFEAESHDVVLHLGSDAALTLKRRIPTAFLVFVLPPSRTTLVNRLKARGMTEFEIEHRMKIDPTRFDAVLDYDLLIVNEPNEQERVARRIVSVIEESRGKVASPKQ